MARTRVSTFGSHGQVQENVINGPHALAKYFGQFAAVEVRRYHNGPSKRRLTRRGTVELTVMRHDGSFFECTATSLRPS